MSGTIRIVLVATSHPGNVGAAARAMQVMGLARLVLVAPQCEIAEEARARARGALDVLDRARCVETLAEAIAGTRFVVATSARPRHLGPAVVAARDGAAELVAELAAGDVAILFGPERSGLDNDAIECANRLWYIPTSGDRGSLNLAAAVQVIAYEILVAINAVPASPEPPAVALAEDVAALCAHFDRVARALGVISARAPRHTLRRMQRLARRARLEPGEVKLLRGFLGAAEDAVAAARPPRPEVCDE